MKLLKKKSAPKKEAPKVNHNHVWLPADDGKSYVCGDCSAKL